MKLLDTGFATDFRRSGLTMAEAEVELGLRERQIQRYIAGECEVPKLVRDRIREIAARRQQQRAEPAFRFIDLFAGIGGIRLGFEAIGGRCVFTSEWDKWSQQTYSRNFVDDEERVVFELPILLSIKELKNG